MSESSVCIWVLGGLSVHMSHEQYGMSAHEFKGVEWAYELKGG